MALREVKPLNSEQWTQVTTALKSGPTTDQKMFLKEALERAAKLQKL